MRRNLKPEDLGDLLDQPRELALAMTLRMSIRYLGSKYGERFADSREGGDGEALLVRLSPGTLRAWDYPDEREMTG